MACGHSRYMNQFALDSGLWSLCYAAQFNRPKLLDLGIMNDIDI